MVAVGSVVISVDAELGWGFHDFAEPPMERIEAARDGWRSLVDLFDRFSVPATWAVVGHLFWDDCDGVHPDHPASPDWFSTERTEWADRPDLRFGGTVLEALLGSDVDHDVGSHTFSHVVATEDWVSRQTFAADVEMGVEALERRGIPVQSFVYPRNYVAHRDVLVENDIVTYRGERSLPQSTVGRLAAKLGPAVSSNRVRLVDPFVDEYGLVVVPPSLYLYGFEGSLATVVDRIWTDPMLAHARQGIDRAAMDDGIFHLWLHPNNLIDTPAVDRLATVLAYLDRRRHETSLRVETMADVAHRVT
ncbi:Peptidoglycan/xylan/chitin deacetylase, PgdA/CDA1 family [Halanaeroarchaeum sp. HSR-CO]|nr:Peptidoglycan/xylan/chitin deacetylase, PgdA/CDA1 family [Halanaeroarchaeum sp. HSR-CO]